jgi:hypothetical protein
VITFTDFLASNDFGAVATAYYGLSQMTLPNVPYDVDVVAGHLTDGVLWKPALRFLASLKDPFDINESLVRGLVVRGHDTNLGVLLLLRVSTFSTGPKLLLKQRGWMYLSRQYPVQIFKMVVVLFTTKGCRKPLSTSGIFVFVLRAALETGDAFVLSAMPVILKQAGLTPEMLDELSQTGFMREVAGQSATMKGEDFLAIAELGGRIGAFQEGPLFTKIILSRMSDEKLLAESLAVLLRLATYPDCADVMTASDLVPYLEVLTDYPRYTEAARKLIASLGSVL